jgi:hypothetical protein
MLREVTRAAWDEGEKAAADRSKAETVKRLSFIV